LYHKLWVSVNIGFFFMSFLYIWFFRPHDSTLVITAQLLAQIAVILFVVNINMYFIFLVIRKTSVRKVKVRLAKFSRVLMKWHIHVAVLGTSVIIGHAAINLYELGTVLGLGHLKLVSGYLALTILTFTLFAGYLRHKKSSGFRRKFHLTAAMVFLAAFLLHMFIPI
jgi:hypothetical protein